MATIWEDESNQQQPRRYIGSNQTPLAQRLKDMEQEITDLQRQKESAKETKGFKFPWKWNKKFKATTKKINLEKVLVMFLNKKNEIEVPTFVPIYSGNIIIYRNKAYEFDPRGIWRMKGVKGFPSVYLIREIDRRPLRNPTTKKLILGPNGEVVYSKDAAVSNQDIEDVRARGDSTESDEFLIKAALKAYTASKQSKPVNWLVIGIVIVVVIVGGYFLMKGNLGS